MKSKSLKRWDAADHLHDPAAQAEYISAVMADGSSEEIRDALNVVAKARGMSDIAEAAGVPKEALEKALGGNESLEFEMVIRIVRAMGMTVGAQTIKE